VWSAGINARLRMRAGGPSSLSGHLWYMVPEAEQPDDWSAPAEGVVCKGWKSSVVVQFDVDAASHRHVAG